MTASWVESWNFPKLPFVRPSKQGFDVMDTDKEVSVHQKNDEFSKAFGLVIIDKNKKKKPLTA